jgi:hypothetical protein
MTIPFAEAYPESCPIPARHQGGDVIADTIVALRQPVVEDRHEVFARDCWTDCVAANPLPRGPLGDETRRQSCRRPEVQCVLQDWVDEPRGLLLPATGRRHTPVVWR